MASKKITVPQVILNNKTVVVAPQTVDTQVKDGVLVAEEHSTNPGVVYPFS